MSKDHDVFRILSVCIRDGATSATRHQHVARGALCGLRSRGLRRLRPRSASLRFAAPASLSCARDRTPTSRPSYPRQRPHEAGLCVLAVSLCSLSPHPVLWPAPPSLCVSLQAPCTRRRHCSSSGPIRYARAAQACRRRAAPLPPCLSLPLAPRCKCRARARLW